MARNVVGLDIGTSAVRAAELSIHRGKVVLVRLGQVGLPPGSVVDGEVVDATAVATAIRALWRQATLGSKRVRLGVANQRVVVRQVDVPWMPPAELRHSLTFQAQDHLPIPVDDAELDFDVLTELEGQGGQRMLRILLVAAQREMIAGHLAAVGRAGLRSASTSTPSPCCAPSPPRRRSPRAARPWSTSGPGSPTSWCTRGAPRASCGFC